MQYLPSVHAVFTLLGYCFLAAQTVNAVLLLMQDYALRRRRFKGIFRLLPPLRQLDGVCEQLLVAGVLLLTGGIVVGLTCLPGGTGGVLIWAAYATLLFLRKKNRLRGVRFARVSVLLFIAALFVLWPAHLNLFRP